MRATGGITDTNEVYIHWFLLGESVCPCMFVNGNSKIINIFFHFSIVILLIRNSSQPRYRPTSHPGSQAVRQKYKQNKKQQRQRSEIIKSRTDKGDIDMGSDIAEADMTVRLTTCNLPIEFSIIHRCN